MSSDASVEEIESLRDEWSGDFLWVRRGDRKFLIRDLPTVKEARTFFAPMQALDPERHALERRQQAIQEEERDLDREEEAIEEEIQDMDDREDDDRSLPAADRDDLERRLRDVRAKMRGVEDRERALDADETALDRRSDALEAKAEAALRALIDRALEKGLARPIGD